MRPPPRKIRAGTFKKARPIARPKCSVHPDKEMTYIPTDMLWKCIMPGCRMSEGPTALEGGKPVVMRSAVEYLEAHGRQFVLFTESMVLVPLECFPEDTLVIDRDREVTVTMKLTKRTLE